MSCVSPTDDVEVFDVLLVEVPVLEYSCFCLELRMAHLPCYNSERPARRLSTERA